MDIKEELFKSRAFTPENGFTSGIEGPATDGEGNLYAVNYLRQHTIGKVTPQGECSVFVELQNGSIANGIRFSRRGDMLVADYTNHNILKIDMSTRQISVFAHEPAMNQPNDICITPEVASDPDWERSTGQIWRVNLSGGMKLMEAGMGTTNGIEVSPDGKKLYPDGKTCYVTVADRGNIETFRVDVPGRCWRKNILKGDEVNG